MKKLIGLRQAAKNTVNWPLNSGGYTEIFVNRSTGEVWTVDQVSLGQNTWTEYNDPEIVKVCNTSCHMTAKQISDAISKI